MDSIIDRRSNTYQLDSDANRGFTTAVRNSQVRLALEYAVIVLHQQSERIAKLEVDLAALNEDKGEAPRRGRRPREANEAESIPTPDMATPDAASKDTDAKKAMAS